MRKRFRRQGMGPVRDPDGKLVLTLPMADQPS